MASLYTLEEQLAITECAIDVFNDSVNEQFPPCLCQVYLVAIYGSLFHAMNCTHPKLIEDIPLFTKENAIKHANADPNIQESDYWWEMDPYDKDNRLLFLNWIKSELEKEVS